MIAFTVLGEPVAQARPRFAVVAGHATAYDPKKSKDYKTYVKQVAADHAPPLLLEGPLLLEIKVFRQIPKSFSKKKEAQAEAGQLRPVTKPDADNYLKGIKDALKNVIWKDDSQVVDVRTSKWYSCKPRIEVMIKAI